MTTGDELSDRLPPFTWRPVAAVTIILYAVLALLSARYGFHRDELYFIAAGDHPAWGYVDQPPLTPMLAKAGIAIIGDGPTGLRLISALVGVATVWVIALAARELGGGRLAQVLAAAGTALSAFVLVLAHMLSTTSVDLLVWAVIGLLALRLLRTGDGRWWLAIGAAVGVGMSNKWLVLLLVAALGVAVLAVGPRQILRTGWLAAGIGVAVLVAAPFVAWQATHGWPQLTVAGGISDEDGGENRALFVPHQLIILSPVLVPVWVAGLVRVWRDPALRWARALAVAYLVLCVMVLALGGKPYYAVPLLLLLVAAGAEPAARWLTQGRRSVRRAVAAAATVVAVAVSVLVALPVLPADALSGPVLAMNKESGEQVGWPRFVDTVAGVWQQIPPDQRATAVIFTRNYGQAGAIEFFGPSRGLPAPHSGHMSYADWGPPPDTMTGPVVLVGARADDTGPFTGCRVVARNDNGLDLDNDDQGTPVALCELSAPWSQVWPTLRHFY